MSSRRSWLLVVLTVLLGLVATGPVAPAAARDIIAVDETQPVAAAAAAAPQALAAFERGIVVTGHGGRPVVLTARGEPVLRKPRPGSSAARFSGLTAGRQYTVRVGGRVVARVTAVNRPLPASRLIVETADAPGAVRLSWVHAVTAATGGHSVRYDLVATSGSAPTVSGTVAGRRSATLTGLDPKAMYVFTVTPRNSAGTGRATRAAMTRPLGGAAAAPTPAPAPLPTPTPTPTPAPTAAAPAPPPAAPATKVVYVCPTGFTERSGMCEKSTPYTYTRKPYTFHLEATGPAPMLDSYETTARACPGGYNFEDYGWVAYCRRYGQAPTASVKDETPTGFTDDGTGWVRKDDPPAGYTDTGVAWVMTVAKVARVVPA